MKKIQPKVDPDAAYSTRRLSKELMSEIRRAIKNVKGWGSVEIHVQGFQVTQITERNIKKTSNGQLFANSKAS